MRPLTKTRSLTQVIVHDLGIAIVTGAYDRAAFPTEAVLSTQYGAARSVTREAVKMLTAKGLLVARPRVGTRVTPEDDWNLLDPDVLRWLLERKFSLDLLIDFTQIRMAVEPAAAALAAASTNLEARAQIDRAVQRMVAAENGKDDSLDADIAFHVSVLHASGNRFYRQLEEMIETALRISIRLTNTIKGRLASVAEHQIVADAIRDGDSTAAAEALKSLIEGALELMLAERARQAKRASGSGGL